VRRRWRRHDDAIDGREPGDCAHDRFRASIEGRRAIAIGWQDDRHAGPESHEIPEDVATPPPTTDQADGDAGERLSLIHRATVPLRRVTADPRQRLSSPGPAWESGVGKPFRDAPTVFGIYTFVLAFGALVVLIPGLDLLPMIVGSQYLQGLLLPVVLEFMVLLVNDRRLMGRYGNGRLRAEGRLGHAIVSLASSLYGGHDRVGCGK
jgi:Natural resistance-associated macrophage protein